MTFIYSLLTFPVSIIYSIALAFSERGRTNLCERFGTWGELPKKVLWFHGASVGEVQGLAPIVREAQRRSNLPILLTVTSATALTVARDLTPHTRLLPFDCWIWIHRALNSISVRTIVIGETEVWPALFSYLGTRGTQIFLINGRLSESSVPKYRFLFTVLPSVIGAITKCLCVDRLMRERFIAIGIDEDKLVVTGNTKYSREPLSFEKGELKRQRFESNGALIVIGNIRPGEEEVILPALYSTITRFPDCCIAVVPRHKEKFAYFKTALSRYKLPSVSWSEERKARAGEVLYVDAFGALERLYADAEGAFVGGSLVDLGGHNPLEPAPYGVTVAIGPHTQNTTGLVPELIQRNAIVPVQNQRDLEVFFEGVCRLSTEYKDMAQRMYAFWKEQQGAVSQTIQALDGAFDV